MNKPIRIDGGDGGTPIRIGGRDGGTPIRIGVVGLGGATSQMLPCLAAHAGMKIAAGADPRREARERFATDFGATGFESAEELCESRDIDAVYIATPHQFHRDNALAAASAGKHVVVEKPMALTIDDCDAMIDACERAGVHLIVGHTHSFDPPITAMRRIIRSGELGPLAMINSFSYGNFLYRPRRPEELDTSKGGGIIFNQVPHQIDLARLLGGGLLRSVRSMAWTLDPERPTEGSHITFLQFEDGAAASLTFSGYDHFDSDEFHSWVGESGEAKSADGHGKARAALAKVGGRDAEVALKAARAYGQAEGGGSKPAEQKHFHHLHCGVTIATCAGGDLRPSADGVLVYDRNGKREISVPRGAAFPDKSAVWDELCSAVATGRTTPHNGRWAKATMEASIAVLTSARERREVMLEHQVALIED